MDSPLGPLRFFFWRGLLWAFATCECDVPANCTGLFNRASPIRLRLQHWWIPPNWAFFSYTFLSFEPVQLLATPSPFRERSPIKPDSAIVFIQSGNFPLLPSELILAETSWPLTLTDYTRVSLYNQRLEPLDKWLISNWKQSTIEHGWYARSSLPALAAYIFHL